MCVVCVGGALGAGGAVDPRLPGSKYQLHLLHVQPRGAAQQVAAQASSLGFFFSTSLVGLLLPLGLTVKLRSCFPPALSPKITMT